MSIFHDVAGLLTLNLTVPPTLVLISVVKPTISSSTPSTRHSLSGVPGLVFSQATLFTTGASQGPAAAALDAPAISGKPRAAVAMTSSLAVVPRQRATWPGRWG